LLWGIALATAITPAVAASALGADPSVLIRSGDTLTGISMRHGVSINRLVELNRIDDPNRIYAGQRLRLGRDSSRDASAPTPDASTVHVVASGSTLWGIARSYGVSMSSIVAANGIADPSRIFAGQRLVIPGVRPAPSEPSRPPSSPARPKAEAGGRVHVVAIGEHLTGIAARYGVTVSEIAAANAIADPSRIFAGQRLTIPGGRPAQQDTVQRPSLPASMARLVAERRAIRQMIVQEADRFGVPRALALAVAWQESGWQQGVVSSAGAVGVMQLLPATAEWVGDTMLGKPVQINDARSNIAAGARLLRHYLDRYGGNRDLTLAAYYQGQTAADRYGVYAVSRPYIASIKLLERLFGG
jgi:LysM repeat protein